jgi:hypothetical protein
MIDQSHVALATNTLVIRLIQTLIATDRMSKSEAIRIFDCSINDHEKCNTELNSATAALLREMRDSMKFG